jgi:hypothetical protein
MTRPRQKPPTIRIGGHVRAMTGNARLGYTLRIDDLFRARVRYSSICRATIYAIRCNGADVLYRSIPGCHEQAGAGHITRWFERRARLWLGADIRRERQ